MADGCLLECDENRSMTVSSSGFSVTCHDLSMLQAESEASTQKIEEFKAAHAADHARAEKQAASYKAQLKVGWLLNIITTLQGRGW